MNTTKYAAVLARLEVREGPYALRMLLASAFEAGILTEADLVEVYTAIHNDARYAAIDAAKVVRASL